MNCYCLQSLICGALGEPYPFMLGIQDSFLERGAQTHTTYRVAW